MSQNHSWKRLEKAPPVFWTIRGLSPAGEGPAQNAFGGRPEENGRPGNLHEGHSREEKR